MDRWLEALAALGGFAAIGGLIDLAMYRSEKAKLKVKLEDWWLRFEDVKWSNFGREEAEYAIEILDRWAGAGLWSGKRWWFATKVTVGAYLITVCWLQIVYMSYHEWKLNSAKVLEQVVTSGVILPPAIVAFAVSLSLTRYIAFLAAKHCRDVPSSMATFIVLLILHVVLLLYWSVIVLFLLMAPLFLVAWLSGLTNLARLVEQLSVLANLDLGRRSFWGLPDDWFWFLGWDYSDDLYIDASMRAFKATMDLVANGIRIAFALVFLSSFVFRPLIQEPISRLWYGAMDSGKPVFTTVFGLIGAVVAVARVLAK